MIKSLIKFLETTSENLKTSSNFFDKIAKSLKKEIQDDSQAHETPSAPVKPTDPIEASKPQTKNKKPKPTIKAVEQKAKKNQKTGMTKVDLVISVIKNYPDGVKNSTISKESGLSGQSLRTALYKAKKAGHIEACGKAAYIISKSQAKPKKFSTPKSPEKIHKVVTMVNGDQKVIRKTNKAVSSKEQILSLVKNSSSGISIPALQKITNYNRSQIAMILTRAVKSGIIKRVGRGTYAGV